MVDVDRPTATLIAWLKKASQAIYLACDESVANDISPRMIEAANRIEAIEAELAAAKRGNRYAQLERLALDRAIDAESRLSEMEKEVERLRAVDHICGLPEFGSYEGQVILASPDWLKHKFPDGIGIDVCLALEIQKLWNANIQTSGHCCGHGRAGAFISVWPEYVEQMRSLGYEKYSHPDGRDDHFVPMTQFAARRLVEGGGKS